MRKVSIKDLATITGLSQATVSLSLRSHPRISEATRNRVLQAAQEAGYVYNRQAASLRLQKTRSVAVCLNTIENPVATRIFTGLVQYLQARDWTVVFGNSEESTRRQSAFLSTALENNVAGLIVLPAVGTTLDDLMEFARFVPTTVVLRDLAGCTLDQVRIDYAGGIRAATDHLIGLGHRRIGWIGAGLPTETSSTGWSTFRDRIREAGLDLPPERVRRCTISRQAGHTAMREMLAEAPDVTAVLCFSDLLASGAIRAMADAGLRPGDDISVVGFDDLEEASYMLAPLTTVRPAAPSTERTRCCASLPAWVASTSAGYTYWASCCCVAARRSSSSCACCCSPSRRAYRGAMRFISFWAHWCLCQTYEPPKARGNKTKAKVAATQAQSRRVG